VITWLIWNWKIWYLTIFIDKDELNVTKLDFIVCNYSDPLFLIWLPLASTLIILTVVQFISNGAYWLDLRFKTWRINQKNSVEGKQLLTLEKSIKIRTEIREQEETFDKMLEKKNDEIQLLSSQLTELKKQLSQLQQPIEKNEEKEEERPKKRTVNEKSKDNVGSSYSSDDYHRLRKNADLFDKFESVAKNLRDNNQFPKDTPENVKEYFTANELIKNDYDAMGNPIFVLTLRGRELYRDYFNRKYLG
jgi:hypothetical protein